MGRGVDDLLRAVARGSIPEPICPRRTIRGPDALRRAVAQFRPDAVVHLAAMHFIPAVDGAPELAWTRTGGSAAGRTRVAAAAATAVRLAETSAPQPLDLYSPKICSVGDRLGDSEVTSRAVPSQSDLSESAEAREGIYHDPNYLVTRDGDVEEIRDE